MTKIRAEHPFQFVTQASLIELTGLRANDIYQLLEHLKSVSGSVLYYHTHHFLKQHQFLSPEPPNDFAYWVTNVLQEDRLGEQLAAIDTIRFSSLKALQESIIGTIERYLAKGRSTRTAPEGEEFHFMKAKSFVWPTSYQASTLAEFIDVIRKISPYSLYHHIFESRLRLEKGTNDFSFWLETELGENKLARAIARLDPYTQPLEGLRKQILRLGQTRAVEQTQEATHATR